MRFWSLLASSSAVAVLCFAACGGSDRSSTLTETSALVPTTARTTIPPAPTTGAETTTTASTMIVETGIAIEGEAEFVEQATVALGLLQEEASDAFAQVEMYVETIRWVPAGSGMDVFTKTFLAAEETAFADGFAPEDQATWFASTIVHDSCHSRLFATDEPYEGRDAELECLIDQLEALETIDEDRHMVDYVQGLVDGIDDPENAYWNDPDRHW